MDNGDRGVHIPFRWILTSISMPQSPVRKASDSDTWLPVTHLPCHYKFMMKCLPACLEKLCQAILKCTVDLQGNDADDISIYDSPSFMQVHMSWNHFFKCWCIALQLYGMGKLKKVAMEKKKNNYKKYLERGKIRLIIKALNNNSTFLNIDTFKVLLEQNNKIPPMSTTKKQNINSQESAANTTWTRGSVIANPWFS